MALHRQGVGQNQAGVVFGQEAHAPLAIECNQQGGRLSEYSPVSFENKSLGKIEGKGSNRGYRKAARHVGKNRL